MADRAHAPSTYEKGKAFYFIDREGRHWRVFDCARVNERHLILAIGSARTQYRVFSSRDGRKCVHFFRPRELRGTRPDHLQRQLRASQDLDAAFDPALEHEA